MAVATQVEVGPATDSRIDEHIACDLKQTSTSCLPQKYFNFESNNQPVAPHICRCQS